MVIPIMLLWWIADDTCMGVNLRGFQMAWNYIGPTGLTGCDFLMVVLIFEALQDWQGIYLA